MRSSALATFVLACTTASAHAQNFSPEDVARRAIERRAVETMNWGIVYWSRLPDWKNQTLTPNPDTVYLFPLSCSR
jgi:hypothetical protein